MLNYTLRERVLYIANAVCQSRTQTASIRMISDEK